MLYLYDRAIIEDLQASFDTANLDNPVKVIDSEAVIDVIAQMKEDRITFPIIAVLRDDDVNIDESRSNFTWMHKGVSCVFDNETNTYYNEKSIPVTFTYTIDILTTNTADMDELLRELMFKYTSMYFLHIRLPYESDRVVRFGVRLDTGSTIQRGSSTKDYIKSGTLYRAVLKLIPEGCVMVNYTPVQLKRQEYEVETR